MWHVHFPEILSQGLRAKERFAYEEFLVLQTALGIKRRALRDRLCAPKLPWTPLIDARIRRLLPFRLTGDQDRAVAAIRDDLASERPMQRLLQADVGAGKTAVAFYAMLLAVANQHQAILMAPTEILARQHARTFDGWLAHSKVRRAILTGDTPPRERQQLLVDLSSGAMDLVIGTTALLGDDVELPKLGLVVIDEQHKFGVEQRATLRRRALDPHYLVMTATPIPRTVALTVFGDLDVTSMRELPPGRQRVMTRWHAEASRPRVEERCRELLRQGRQLFVVCPLVTESESLDVTAALQQYDALRQGAFKDFRVGLLHGRLPDNEKDHVMQQFRDRQFDVLVTTLVVEVGVDVPNANVMIVEHAERFGLSQLHQLRGRVSRGSVAGEFNLFAQASTDDARERLRAITRITDGFELAEEDARLRGLGEFFGTRQHGLGELRFGDVLADRTLLEQARRDALEIVARDAGLQKPEHQALRHTVLQQYGGKLDLATIG
jgi:ATP-dependent DNA helicase RecG